MREHPIARKADSLVMTAKIENSRFNVPKPNARGDR